MRRAFLAFAPFVLVACARPAPPPVTELAAGSDAAARRVVISFYTAYVAGDVDAALSHLCERDSRSQAAAREFISRSQAPSSPFRVDRFDVKGAEPLWAGSDPYFYVEVGFPREGGSEIAHAHRVRARDGCIERFLGGPAPPPGADARPPDSDPVPPPSLDPTEVPAPPVLEAPVGDDDEVVEL